MSAMIATETPSGGSLELVEVRVERLQVQILPPPTISPRLRWPKARESAHENFPEAVKPAGNSRGGDSIFDDRD
jgi:hypothetical protein